MTTDQLSGDRVQAERQAFLEHADETPGPTTILDRAADDVELAFAALRSLPVDDLAQYSKAADVMNLLTRYMATRDEVRKCRATSFRLAATR